jgi:hypothetical protein
MRRSTASSLSAATALIGVLAAAPFACVTRASELPPHAGEIQNHLEFLGYEVSQDDDSILAIHEERPNLQIRGANGGTLLLSYWRANGYAREHRAEFLELVNDFNTNATTATFYIDERPRILRLVRRRLRQDALRPVPRALEPRLGGPRPARSRSRTEVPGVGARSQPRSARESNAANLTAAHPENLA